jgi:hypothetical protein
MTVTAESPSTVPGGTVNAVVTITGDPDEAVRGATARLVRTALVKVTETNVLSHGYHDSLLSDDVVVAEAPLRDSRGRVLPGEHVVSLALPADALPSATKVVSWSVRAVIDRRHGIDVKAKAPLEVLVGPERFADEATTEPRYVGERCVDLELPTRTLRPGEALTGNVVVRSTRAMTLNEVFVGLARTVGTAKGHDTTAVVTQGLLDEPLVLEAGDTRTYPFDLTLPDDADPTVLGQATTPPCASHIAWAVTAVAEPVRSPDERYDTKPGVSVSLNVYNANVAPPPLPGEAEETAALDAK